MYIYIYIYIKWKSSLPLGEYPTYIPTFPFEYTNVISLRHLSDLDPTSKVFTFGSSLPEESLAADLRRQSTVKGCSQPDLRQAKGTTKMDEVNSEAK